MTSNKPLTLGDLPTEFQIEAQRKMDEWGLDAEKQEKVTTSEFKNGVSDCYRDRVLAKIRPLGGDLLGIAEQAAIGRQTRWKWEHRGVLPDWDNLLVAATAYRLDWDGVFPCTHDAVMSGVCKAIADIRLRLLRHDRCECDPSIVYLLWFVTSNLKCQQQLTSTRGDVELPNRREILSFVSQMSRRPVTWNSEQIRELIAEWWDGYLLFHSLIKFRWEV